MDPRSPWVPPLGPVGSPVAMGNSTKGDLYTYIHPPRAYFYDSSGDHLQNLVGPNTMKCAGYEEKVQADLRRDLIITC